MTSEITEAMVHAAVKAFNDTYYSVEYSKRHSIQSAVEAALVARTAPEARSVVERLRAELIEAQAAQIASLSAKVAEVERERDEAQDYAFEATKAITSLTAGGSEFFAGKLGDRYKADLSFCVEHIRQRDNRRHSMNISTRFADMDGKKKLEELVASVADSFPVTVSADTIRSISDAYKAIEAENERLRRLIADRDYMLHAYRSMLGPKGREVADTWVNKGVQRIHFDWGPEAQEMSGEDRAAFLLELENAPWTPVDNIDNLEGESRHEG